MRIELACVALAFLALTLVFTWPLAAHVTTSVLGPPADNYYFVWLVGWYEKALFELHRLPLSVPQLNYPEGWNLAYNEMTPAMVAIGLPFAVLGGPVLGYNSAMLISFVLSGLGVYLWVRRLTGNCAAAVIAGTLFAFAPYRMVHLLGHLNLMGTQWLPFFFLSLHQVLQRRTWSWGPLVLAAGYLGLIGLTSLYYLYMTLVVSVAYVGGYLLLVERDTALGPRFRKRMGTLAALALPVILLCIWPYAQLVRQGSLPAQTLEGASRFSASLGDFLLPSIQHAIWGRWIAEHFDRGLWGESTLYVGMVALGLAGLALVKHHRGRRAGEVRWLALIALVASILALGTNLHWGQQSVLVPVPAAVRQWYPYAFAPILLPGYLLLKLLPFYAYMRVWMRYGVFANLFVSVLAGLGSAWLLQEPRRRHVRLATGLLLSLVLLDFWPGRLPMSQIRGRVVDTWLASRAEQGAVAQFPFSQSTAPYLIYFTLVHGKPYVSTFCAAFDTPQSRRIQPTFSRFPDEASIALLQELGVRWVVVSSRQYRQYWGEVRATIEALGLRLAFEADGQYVYELAPGG